MSSEPGRDGNPQELVDVGDARQGRDRPQLDVRSDPLTWLDSRNMLRDPLNIGLTPSQLSVTRGASMYRLQAGRSVQQTFFQAEVSPIGSPDFELKVDSSGGAPEVRVATLDAMRDLKQLRLGMRDWEWKLLRQVLAEGFWPWTGLPPKLRRARYEEVRLCLDRSAVYLGMMVFKDFLTRWPA